MPAFPKSLILIKSTEPAHTVALTSIIDLKLKEEESIFIHKIRKKIFMI